MAAAVGFHWYAAFPGDLSYQFFPMAVPDDDRIPETYLRSPLVDGRQPDPSAPLEVALSERSARTLGVGVGDPLPVTTFTDEQAAAAASPTPRRAARWSWRWSASSGPRATWPAATTTSTSTTSPPPSPRSTVATRRGSSASGRWSGSNPALPRRRRASASRESSRRRRGRHLLRSRHPSSPGRTDARRHGHRASDRGPRHHPRRRHRHRACPSTRDAADRLGEHEAAARPRSGRPWAPSPHLGLASALAALIGVVLGGALSVLLVPRALWGLARRAEVRPELRVDPPVLARRHGGRRRRPAPPRRRRGHGGAAPGAAGAGRRRPAQQRRQPGGRARRAGVGRDRAPVGPRAGPGRSRPSPVTAAAVAAGLGGLGVVSALVFSSSLQHAVTTPRDVRLGLRRRARPRRRRAPNRPRRPRRPPL